MRQVEVHHLGCSRNAIATLSLHGAYAASSMHEVKVFASRSIAIDYILKQLSVLYFFDAAQKFVRFFVHLHLGASPVVSVW